MMSPAERDAKIRREHDCVTCSGRHGVDPVIGMGRGEWPACTCGWLSGQDFSLAEHLSDMSEDETPAARLEYLRGELRAERISQGELIELADLAPHIDPDDVELLESAGVPEHGPAREAHRRQWNAAHHVATD